jgi:hypothetical protein
MSDIPRHDAPQPDDLRHTLTVREVEVMFANAGVQRSHRHVLRLCQSGMLDAVKIPGGPSGEEWYVAPVSVPKAIGDLKQIDAQKARRSAAQPDTSDDVAAEAVLEINTDTSRHDAPRPGTSEPIIQEDTGTPEPVAARHAATEHDIYDHPYVKRLEERVDKLEAKYDAQVRRTEEIQIKSQAQLVELQRMTAVGQSQTLADFMLKAKDWLIGQGSETERKGGDAAAA